MQKLTQKERKNFLKLQPFNFCDQFCERCGDMKNHCQVYKEDIEYKMECLREGKDPQDPGVAFERISKMLSGVREMLEKDMKKMGVDVSVEVRKVGKGEIIREDERIEKHPYFALAMKTTIDVQKFLSEFDPLSLSEPLPWAGEFWIRELEEMSFYAPLIFIKGARAVHSLFEDGDGPKRFPRSDRLVSATLSYCSMLTVDRSLNEIHRLIRRDEPIWALKVAKILRTVDSAKRACLETFPEVENSRKKIIFHGNIESCVE